MKFADYERRIVAYIIDVALYDSGHFDYGSGAECGHHAQ